MELVHLDRSAGKPGANPDLHRTQACRPAASVCLEVAANIWLRWFETDCGEQAKRSRTSGRVSGHHGPSLES